MRLPGLLLLWALAAAAQQDAPVGGMVRDAQTGEPLRQVRIQILQTAWQAVTDAAGFFEVPGVQPGAYTLQAATVGYRMVRKDFTLAAGETKEFDVILSPDTFRQTDSVEVHAGPFEALRSESPSELTLVGNELKNLASVLADDPLRSVQAMPGVASDDDFNARFSVRGADYDRIGLYLDDVLLHSPFHAVEERGAGGTLTIFNGDMLQDVTLYAGAPPARYADRTAGALDVRMREASRAKTSVRGTASASNAGVMAEGPLGRGGQGSWMAGIRKSYLQYIVKRTTSDPTIAGGFWDAQGRVSYDVLRNHNVSLSVFNGSSGLDRTESRSRLGINSLMTSAYHFTLVDLAWRYVPGERFFASSRLAWSREKFDNLNPDELALAAGHYGEWVWNTNATWMWGGQNALDAGLSVRRLRDGGFSNVFQFNPLALRKIDEYAGTGVMAGGYAQQSFVLASGLLHLSAGARWDRFSADNAAAASPQASVALLPRPSTRLQFAWGEYAQFPELRWLYSRVGSRRVIPERAIHYLGAVEQRIGDRSRVRLELYQRLDRDLLFRPFYDPRIIAGRIYNPPLDTPVFNSSRGYARGAEIFFQRRTANRFTGWVSYALGYARQRDGFARASFPSDQDQRHTVNVYGSYRVRPTVNLSLKWLYGSGFPIPGFLRPAGGAYFLADRRNEARLEPYRRTDARINKAYVFDRYKLTLYGEVVNLFNRDNRRFDSFNGYNSWSGQAYLGLNRMFPILPSAGVMIEF